MKIKLTNNYFENTRFFEVLGEIHKSDKLPIMDAYRINRLVKKVTELNEEYLEHKTKLLEQYGTPDESNEGRFTIKNDDNQKVFLKEMNDLLSIENVLETELLPWPEQLEDGVSAADIDIIEILFNLKKFESKEEKEKSTEEK